MGLGYQAFEKLRAVVMDNLETIAGLVDRQAAAIVARWRALLDAGGGTGGGRIKDNELQTQCRDFLAALRSALASGETKIAEPAFEQVRALLDGISRSRAAQGFSPSETATFVFSLKEPLFEQLRAAFPDDAGVVAESGWQMTQLIDQLGLYTMEVYQKSREEVVRRQQDEIAELSTPVVKLWDGILALPLIGTLDSARTQVVMENLLQAIVDQSADLAIIDITGVPTVDTLVAQHLLKTIAAARLMGADCIISGIRPQIAQTMVHLGVELDVVSKATLAEALLLAFQRTGRSVVRKARG
ncbi:STAS domain-containing protein [Sphingomonas sp. 1P08PE]|uniref:STAS domain-containing protein n=1 Tax=Sphingomonas sp. 1P08PE TaxID=554122 RepID=UPI0039A0B983